MPDDSSRTGAFATSEGVNLCYEDSGSLDAPPVILLHGGGQTRQSWRATATALVNAGFRAVRYDARGHGESDWSQSGDYELDAYVRDLRELKAQLAKNPILVGASLGGLTSLLAVGADPPMMARALVLIDVTPVINSRGVARIKSFMSSHPEGFETLDAAAAAVAAYQPHRRKKSDPSRLMRNLRRGENGLLQWHWDPRMLEFGAMPRERLEQAARRISIPTLLIRGKESDIVTDEEAAAFRRLCPSAEQYDVAAAHHMIVGDDNQMANDVLLDFLSRTVPSSR